MLFVFIVHDGPDASPHAVWFVVMELFLNSLVMSVSVCWMCFPSSFCTLLLDILSSDLKAAPHILAYPKMYYLLYLRFMVWKTNIVFFLFFFGISAKVDVGQLWCFIFLLWEQSSLCMTPLVCVVCTDLCQLVGPNLDGSAGGIVSAA